MFLLGEVGAFGLKTGSCPIGIIVDMDDRFIKVALYSFLTYEFDYGHAIFRKEDIEQVSVAAQDSPDTYAMDPLAAFQTMWLERGL